MKMLPPEELVERIRPFAEAKGFQIEPYHLRLIPLLVERMHTLKDFVELADYIFTDDSQWMKSTGAFVKGFATGRFG